MDHAPSNPGRPPESRRERKKQDTRDRLIDAAVVLFAEQGYDATTMDQIAERADVARATVFNYFARKEDLVLGWVARRRTAVEASLRGSELTRDTPERLRQAFTAISELYEADRVCSRVMVRCFLQCGGPLTANGLDTAHVLERAVAEGQARGDIAAGIAPRAAACALLDVYLGELYRWAARERVAPGALRAAWLAALDLALAGLAPRPGGRAKVRLVPATRRSLMQKEKQMRRSP
jgi:AcrR family transcriptional regulator